MKVDSTAYGGSNLVAQKNFVFMLLIYNRFFQFVGCAADLQSLIRRKNDPFLTRCAGYQIPQFSLKP
jgi:hypothetical protein